MTIQRPTVVSRLTRCSIEALSASATATPLLPGSARGRCLRDRVEQLLAATPRRRLPRRCAGPVCARRDAAVSAPGDGSLRGSVLVGPIASSTSSVGRMASFTGERAEGEFGRPSRARSWPRASTRRHHRLSVGTADPRPFRSHAIARSSTAASTEAAVLPWSSSMAAHHTTTAGSLVGHGCVFRPTCVPCIPHSRPFLAI